MNTQETHFQRMEKELADLRAKIGRFKEFLKSEKFQNCDPCHKMLIKRQYLMLKLYRDTISDRITYERLHPEVQ